MLRQPYRLVAIRGFIGGLRRKYPQADGEFLKGFVNAQHLAGWPGIAHPSLADKDGASALRSFHASPMHSTLVNVLLAQTGEGIKECELIHWHVKEGDSVAEFQQLCEVQSDKASVEITSQYEGTVTRLLHSEGDIVQVGDALLELESASEESYSAEGQSKDSNPPEAEAGSRAATAADTKAESSSSKQQDISILASPAVRRVAREHKVDLAAVTGTGANGRITQEDVLRAVEQKGDAPQAAPGPQEAARPVSLPSALPGSDFAHKDGEPVVKQIRGYGRAMVRTMTAASAVPHFHFHDDVRMTKLMRMRKELQATPQGERLTMLPFILKALSRVLTDFPDVNATLQSDQKAIVWHRHHNIGVAIATPTGLVVPNIKGAESLSISEIAAQLWRLQKLAEEGHLYQEDLEGGTITVSNIGSIGGTYANPLVNVPEVAILALGRVRPMATESTAQPGIVMQPFLPMSWGADHRVLDGATLAKCSMAFKALLEHPERLLLDMR